VMQNLYWRFLALATVALISSISLYVNTTTRYLYFFKTAFGTHLWKATLLIQFGSTQRFSIHQQLSNEKTAVLINVLSVSVLVFAPLLTHFCSNILLNSCSLKEDKTRRYENVSYLIDVRLGAPMSNYWPAICDRCCYLR